MSDEPDAEQNVAGRLRSLLKRRDSQGIEADPDAELYSDLEIDSLEAAELSAALEELKYELVEASAGDGLLTVEFSGDLELRQVRIAPEALTPEKAGLIEDLFQQAVNEAIQSAQQLTREKLSELPGGLAVLSILAPADD